MAKAGNQMVGRHAVVIGGSMAGLATARTLSDHYEQVTLIERDRLTDSPEPRKGVPQGRHLHGLLMRGEEILAGLFPDLMPALFAAGAVHAEFGRDVVWFHYGAWKNPLPEGGAHRRVFGTAVTRPFLEAEVRRRVLALPNLKVLDGHEVSGFTTDAQRSRVTGVTARRVGASEEQTVAADLVADTCGRGSQTPRWLEQIGRPPVVETVVKVDVGYATRFFERPKDGTHPWQVMFIMGEAPLSRRFGILEPVEGGRWMAVMAGMLGDHPPADPAGWMEYARNLPVPDLYHAVKDVKPLGDVNVYKFPSHQRRHYERMREFPEGLVVLGDSHCSFNPIYAQGMTTALTGAAVLGQELARWSQRGAPSTGLSRTFQRALAKATNDPWALSTGEDFRHPEVSGARPFGTAFVQWYTRRMLRLSATDPVVAAAFYRVMHMLSPLSELLQPGMLLRVLKGAPPASPASGPAGGRTTLASPPAPGAGG